MAESNGGFSGEPGVSYRFTDEQLARMSATKLDTNRFLAYLKRRWPLKRIQAYCVPANQRPELMQNLVAVHTVVETDLYPATGTGFDRIWVYVSQDDGTNKSYWEDAGRNWHRWQYSLNIDKGAKDWVIGGALPNDFMDSVKYDVRTKALSR